MKLCGLWMKHVALGLLCLFLLSAFQSASALPGRSKGIGSHRSGSDKGSHGIGGLLSGHDDKKNNGKPDEKKHGLGDLFGHGDKNGGKDDPKDHDNGKTDDKKHGQGDKNGDKKDPQNHDNGKPDDKKHGQDDKNGGKGDPKNHDNGKPGDKNPGKDSKHGKDKCEKSKGGSSRGRKPSPRDITARDLALRAGTISVAQDDMRNSPAHGQTLHTDKLRTCIGIAITGEEGIFQHWLLHVSATRGQVNDAISKLKKDWGLMGPKKDVKIYLSAPDPDPCKSDPAARDLIEQSQKMAQLIEDELKSLTGSTPRVIHRPARDKPSGHEGTMEVDGDGKVYVEGSKVN
ncbi:hypothetical protein EYZ11_008995 [Aspergillus tanneri]|uniref:Uncharacterized protein n=1 Tax=Aspergillus tanneri TaxID=1220188 RepID=A0A4S3J9C5_9EURO|nr:uncharacterized protein ATNIH1004_007454 [Aspergillus tanneri]KAA8646032.1 hypothetical protein ATNIH1004_007454 [Aspergillus tanneri]THC91532.1 hypothetical protein EYZ11_008995 [Aspergillus tanneri]